jgi:hypothetical protein
MHPERGFHLNVRVKFLEAFSDSCEGINLPYADRNYLIQEIMMMTDSELSLWIQMMDESTYTLSEWLESLVFFQSWLKEQQKGKNFTDQIEYISCCIQGSSNTGRLLTLKDLLNGYLDSFGVK